MAGSTPSALGQLGKLEPLALQSTPALIADRLRSEILDGTFPPLTQMSEVELARALQVSRGPIREAMQRLIQEGLLHAERNRGVFVVELGRDDARDVYLARGAVERAAATIVTRRADPEVLNRLEAIVDRIAEAAGGSWSDVMDHDLGFHETLVEAAGSPRLTRMFRTLIAETRLCLGRLEPFYAEGEDVVTEHRQILDAIRARNVRGVDRLIQLHMDASAARLSVPGAEPRS